MTFKPKKRITKKGIEEIKILSEDIKMVNEDFEKVSEDFKIAFQRVKHKNDLKNTPLLYVTAFFAILDIVIFASIIFCV